MWLAPRFEWWQNILREKVAKTKNKKVEIITTYYIFLGFTGQQ